MSHSNCSPKGKVLYEAKSKQKYKAIWLRFSESAYRQEIKGKRRYIKNILESKGGWQCNSANMCY